jgi:hypothetical protein
VAQENDLLVDPYDLPGEVLVEIDQEVEGFLEVLRLNLRALSHSTYFRLQRVDVVNGEAIP